MTFPEHMTMYCTICGAPIFKPGAWEDAPSWLSNALLLYQMESEMKKTTEQTLTIVTVPAVNQGGPYFTIESTDAPADVTACDLESLNFWLPRVPVLYLPLHQSCLSIVNDVLGSKSEILDDTSFRKVWKVLHARFVSSSKAQVIPLTKLYIDSGYYGIYPFHGMEWEGHGDNEAGYFVADPEAITDLTVMLLRNLQPSSDKPIPRSDQSGVDSPRATSISNTVKATEIQLERSNQQSESRCAFEISASVWKEGLVAGSILPWLPGLDRTKIELKEAEVTGRSSGCDWELLVQQIAALEFRGGPTAVEESGMHVPRGLWNRRRIWQLVEDILQATN